jgi:hypothetical protein
MNLLDLLRAARAKIAEKEHWTQGAYARDRFGHLADTDQAEATCWCSIGVLWAVAPNGSPGAPYVPNAVDVLGAVAKKRGYTNAIGLNDASGHKEVLSMYDAAIAEVAGA